jgi:hypothetical protein
MKLTAFILGLAAFGLVNADVSHLTKHQQTGHNTYVANDGRVVKQSFNSNGGAAFSNQAFTGNNQNSNRYWWMNTENLPFTKTHQQSHQNHHQHQQQQQQQQQHIASGCNRCATSTLHLKNHNTHNNDYNQNSYTKGRYITRQPNIQIAPIAGSHFSAQNYQSSTPCTDSNSACIEAQYCSNGVIEQYAVTKASRSTVSQHHPTHMHTTSNTKIVILRQKFNLLIECETFIVGN